MSRNSAADNKSKPGIFDGFQIGKLPLKNRLIALPIHTGYSHPNGAVSPILTDFYKRIAGSGVAMTVVANAAVSWDGAASSYNLRIDHDRYIQGLSALADSIRQQGALSCLQLNHAGMFAKAEQPQIPYPLDARHLLSYLSSLRDFMHFFPLEKRYELTRHLIRQSKGWRRGMADRDLKQVIASFGAAAERAFRARFDMIELHGAGGYLLSHFILPPFHGMYGVHSKGAGLSPKGIPILRSIIRAAKRNTPQDYPIGFRLMINEVGRSESGLKEAVAVAEMLQKEGIGYISLSAGSHFTFYSSSTLQDMSRPGYLRKAAAALRQRIDVPLVISGRITTPSLAQDLIGDSGADLIGLGRSVRADENWVKMAAFGREHRIQACINCNWCLKRVILDEGFCCKRWSRKRQDRTDLDHKMLSRNTSWMLVIADIEDLELHKTCLPVHFSGHPMPSGDMPQRVLVLHSGSSTELPGAISEWAGKFRRKMTAGCGGAGDPVVSIQQTGSQSRDRMVLAELNRYGNGLVFLGHNAREAWRKRLIFKARGKTVVLLGSHCRQCHALVPVDLSKTTLLILEFIHRFYSESSNFSFEFVHVLTGPSGPARVRWDQLKGVAGVKGNPRMTLIPLRTSVAEDLLAHALQGSYGTVIMGKRGLSDIKRRLLGSVSAKLLRGLTNQTVCLVD